MPAKKTYNQSQIDAALDAIMALPAGPPPEPTFDRLETLRRLKDGIRKQRKNNVSFDEIVKKLNEHGIKATVREIKDVIAGEPKVAKSASVPPVKNCASSENKPTASPTPNGSFDVAPDPEGF